MARPRQPLDAEQVALHDSWLGVVRIIVLVALNAFVVWAVVTGLKAALHATTAHLLDAVTDRSEWWAPAALGLLLVAGGLLRGLLNRREGWQAVSSDGIDVTLANYHCTYADTVDDPSPRYERPTFTLAARKAFATLLTLTTGGSGGIEGPSVLIGEATGAGFARTVGATSEHELRTYQLTGITAAVATLLGAPFTAALFALEVMYGDRIAHRKLAYCLFAAVIPYALNNRLHGHETLFSGPELSHAPIYTLSEYGLTALVAVAVSAPVALGFGLAMKHARAAVERAHPVLRGAAGGLGAALVAIGLLLTVGMSPSHVLGMGDGTVVSLLAKSPEASLSSWWFLLLIVAGRILTTAFTIQSGGSAGMLIPAMVLGGVSGAATAQFMTVLGVAVVDPRLFVIVGIASALVAVVGVPLAAIALVLEVFGAVYGPPAVVACALTYVLTLRLRVYERQPKPALVARLLGVDDQPAPAPDR